MSASSTSTPLSLRERQAAQVRSQLLECYLQQSLDHGLDTFTMQDVADAAGVSLRTLYRYFPNREALLEEAMATTQRTLAERRDRHGSWLSNPDFFAQTFEVFAEHQTLIRVAVMMIQQGRPEPGRAERTELTRSGLTADPELDPSVVPQLTGLLRLLGSVEAWSRMTAEDVGLDARSAGHASQWAVETLIAAARNERGPLRGGRRTTS